ncbi:MAG: 3-deoxy-7-phosphoheptulonate synthase [Pirellulaceae bacterium]
MIIILKSGVSDSQIDHVVDVVQSLGFATHVSRGTFRTIVGLIGDESTVAVQKLKSIVGVADVIPVLPAYKLASLEAHPQPSIVSVGRVRVGGGHLAMIAGPCAVESAQRMDSIAKAVKAAGVNILRGGAFKPRTSPYSFQGLGIDGLKILRETGDRYEMPVVTEVTDPRSVPDVNEYADLIQIGARNMQNFVLLTEVGQSQKPVLLKRGMSATLEDLLMSAEYVLSQGNPNVILCERGIKGFDRATRNVFDVAAVPALKALSHLPVIVDPSHATGRPDLIPSCAYAGLAAGADGVHIEVHDCPEERCRTGHRRCCHRNLPKS